MPAPLSVPRVPPGFPPLAADGGPTVSPGGPTALRTEAGGPTASPGGQTARRTGAGGLTASPGGPTARPCAAPPSPTSTASRVAPMTSAAAPASMTPAAPPTAPASQLYPLHYSRRPRATREPPAPPHKLAPRSTRCIFLGYSADHKGYRCLDLTTNNIVVSRHVVFDEADFPFSASPRLTNDLDILLQDDSPGAAPMPAPLSAPRVPLGFPPLAVAGSPTVSPGGPTALGTGAGGPTVRPGGQTARRTGAGGPTVSPGGPTA
jgi:hypothetical protein